MMKKQFPKWARNLKEDNQLILTDDLDSLLSCLVLNKLFGCQIEAFYNFNSIYYNNNIKKDKLIGVDMALIEGKTFDNHVTMISEDDTVNPLSANVNSVARITGGKGNDSSYTCKYAGSTLLTILSYYNKWQPLMKQGQRELTEMQKLILLCVDSHFFGKYFKGGKYYDHWAELMQLEFFDDIYNKYTKQDLIDFRDEHKLKGKIAMEDGELRTNLDLEFLKEHFPTLDFGITNTFDNKKTIKQDRCRFENGVTKDCFDEDFYTLAVIYNDKVKYTYK